MAAHSILQKKKHPSLFHPSLSLAPPLQHGKREECLVYRCEKVVLGKRNFSLSLSLSLDFSPHFYPLLQTPPYPPQSFPFSAFFNLVSVNFLAVPHLFIVGLIWRDFLTLFDNFSLPPFFVTPFLPKRVPLQITTLLKWLFFFHNISQDVLK